MRRFSLVLLVCVSAACADEVASRQDALSLVQLPFAHIEARYRGILRDLKTAEWGQYCGADGGDLAAAQSARAEFLLDADVDAELEELADSRAPSIARRARTWLRYRAELKPTSDPEVVALRNQLAALMADERVGTAVFAVVAGVERDQRTGALAVLEQTFRSIEDLAFARAQRLDAVAQSLGHATYVELRPGLHARQEVLAECRAQAAATASGWRALRTRASAELGRAPTLEDLLAEATRWTDEASAFLSEVPAEDYAAHAFSTLGFDPGRIDDIRPTDRRAARAFGVSIPREVRFCGHTPPGYQGSRDYLHEFSHGVHMKHIRAPHLPERTLPNDTGLAEGVAETFALLASDHSVLRDMVPDVGDRALSELDRSVAAYESAAVRYLCLHALVEGEWQAGERVTGRRFADWVEEFFGEAGHTTPVFVLLPYLFLTVDSSLSVQDFVWANKFRDAFVESLGRAPLASFAAGRQLAQTVLAHGNGLTLARWLDRHAELEPSSQADEPVD